MRALLPPIGSALAIAPKIAFLITRGKYQGQDTGQTRCGDLQCGTSFKWRIKQEFLTVAPVLHMSK
ncbi:MAG: hypothetical protein BWY74_03094 [Firmicutes bacterium ADurb.Bin419]|nr:MAG: hypothetical protein BWY74_03094 [Firmicutes bacterium ADurb.Bin419]